MVLRPEIKPLYFCGDTCMLHLVTSWGVIGCVCVRLVLEVWLLLVGVLTTYQVGIFLQVCKDIFLDSLISSVFQRRKEKNGLQSYFTFLCMLAMRQHLCFWVLFHHIASYIIYHATGLISVPAKPHSGTPATPSLIKLGHINMSNALVHLFALL
jgi:hypothetical protein